MDNFELNTFACETNIDWDLFGGEAVMSSQASQQSDYLRNIDLGLDISDFDFLQSTPQQGCVDEVKQEPESPMYDVLDQLLYGGSDATMQQLSPDVTVAQQLQQFGPPNDQQCITVYVNDQMITVNPEAIQQLPIEVLSVDLGVNPEAIQQLPIEALPVDLGAGDEDEIVNCRTPSTCSNVSDDDGEFTPDSGVSFTFIKTPTRPTLTHSRSVRRTRDSAHDRSQSSLFSDDYLRRVSTKEFNRRIQELHLPMDEVKKWKRRRRTLKNRGYAQNCRQRRIGKHQEADEENMRLHKELKEERAKSARLRQRVEELEALLETVRGQNNRF